jgi:hypothetical protein
MGRNIEDLGRTLWIFFLGFLFGAMMSYFITREVWSKSQAMNILKTNGIVMSGESLEYYSNFNVLTSKELEALSMLSSEYESVIVYHGTTESIE